MDMYKMGLSHDIVTYSTLINGYCKVTWVMKMSDGRWEPDIRTYSIRIHGFCTARKIKWAGTILEELISAGVVPTTVTYNTMITAVQCHPGTCYDGSLIRAFLCSMNPYPRFL